MVLMHAHWNMRIKFNCGADQMGQDNIIGKRARAPAGLHDHRAVGGIGGGHDRQHLFHIVHIERG